MNVVYYFGWSISKGVCYSSGESLVGFNGACYGHRFKLKSFARFRVPY